MDRLMSYWLRWKRWWRALETAPLTMLAKRRVRQLFGRELRHFVEVRIPTVQYGDWVFSPTELRAGGTAYSLGVGEDAILDIALIERFALEVHAFDPTPRAVAWVAGQKLPASFHFHPVGVAGYDGTAEFAASSKPDDPSFTLAGHASSGTERAHCEVRRLSTLAQQLGHRCIEMIKIDIEGAEYAVIDDLLRSELKAHQILVEFHHRFKGVGHDRTAQAVQSLRRAGYRIFAISPNGQEYSFVLRSA
jgi:FkbM family methyltransferase